VLLLSICFASLLIRMFFGSTNLFVSIYVASVWSPLFLSRLASGQLSVARSHLIACSVGSKMIVGGGSVNGYPSNAIDLYVLFA
jgi:hypothetical protein